MGAVVRWCLKNRSVVFLAAVLLVASGAYATTQLNQELLPEIEFPIVTVSTPVPGAGPDLVDEQVTQPVEAAVDDVEGIESIQSTSSAGFSVVLIEFALDTDTEEAEAELNSALDGVALPQQAEEPEVRTQSASEFPIMSVSLSADEGELAGLTDYARDDAVPLIEDVEGVASAELVGGSERQIEVRLDTQALDENGLSADAVVGAIGGAAGVNTPVGEVEIDGLATPVRTTSGLADAEALAELPVGVSGGVPSGAPSGAPAGIPAGAVPGGAAASAPPAGVSAASAAPSSAPPEPVLLGDVAEVREAPSDIAGISRTNGEPSLGINVTKEPDANTVEVAEGVEGALEEIRGDVGADQVNVLFNSAEDVEESVSGLIDKALIGGGLAILIIFLFLGSLRATLVTAVSLPTSILAALLFSWADNLTLNIITLAGLTIAVGRVVDDAIVVLENSYRYVQRGYGPEEAALRGSTEVASAITSSTLTTTAVFVPLGLVGGIVSKFFLPLSLTVAFALLASLLVSITIIPVLASAFIKRRPSRGEQDPEPRAGEAPVEVEDDAEDEEFLEGESRRLRRARNGRRGVLRWILGLLVVLAALGVGAAVAARAGLLDAVPGVPAGVVDTLDGFAGAVLGGLAGVDTGSPVFLAAAGGLAALLIVVLAFLAVRAARRGRGRRSQNGGGLLGALYVPALRWSLRHRLVVVVLAVLAFAGGLAVIPFLAVSFFPPSEERLLQASTELPPGTAVDETADELKPFEDYLLEDPGVEGYQLSVGGEDNFNPDTPLRAGNQAQAFITVREDASVSRTLDRIDAEGRDLYGEDFQVDVLEQGPPAGGLEVLITGGSEAELREASNLVTEELQSTSGVTNVESDLSDVSPEVEVALDAERAAAAGLSPTQVPTSLGALLGGGAQLSVGETPVSVGVPEGSVDSLEEVRALPVGSGATVGDVAEVTEEEAPAAVSRVDGDRAVTVTGTITAEDTSGVSSNVTTSLSELDLPEGVSAQVGGESEDIEESFRNLILSIAVALGLVYLILVVFFGSLVVPLIILLAVPLTTVGAFGALLITGTALSVPALLGVLLLIGIVVSNAILLVDFIQNARERHETVDEAIVEAGRTRLRPILMTALATIFALTPLAFGFGGGGSALISSSLAIPVIGGLITSTFLTLLVVPVGYSLLLGRRKKRG